MPYRTPAISHVTADDDPQLINGGAKSNSKITLADNALKADGTLTIPDSYVGTGGPMQFRRWKDNVQRVSGSTSIGTNAFWRMYLREAPNVSTTPAALRGKRTTAALTWYHPLFTNYRVNIWWRRTYGNGTKMVWIMWPDGGWDDPLVPLGRGHEGDFAECFDDNGPAASQPKVTNNSPMHYRRVGPPTNPNISGQVIYGDHKINGQVVDYSDWHNTTFLQNSKSDGTQVANLLIDGYQCESLSPAGSGWPITDPRGTCPAPQRLTLNSSLLVPKGTVLIDRPFEACNIDIAKVTVEEWYLGDGGGTNSAPPIPQSPRVTDPGSTTARVDWVAVTDPEGAAVTYILQLAPAPGGTPGTWATIGSTSGISGTTYLATGLTASTQYALRVAAQDERGLAGRSGYSNTYLFTTAAAGTTRPVAGMVITGTDTAGAAVSIAAGGSYTSVGPFTGSVLDTGSSGTINRRTIDPNDTSGQTFSGATLPGGGWLHTWTELGSHRVVLTVTDTSQTPEQSDSVAATIVIAEDTGETSGPNLRLPLVHGGHSEAIRADHINRIAIALDRIAGGVVFNSRYWQEGGEEVYRAQLATQPYPSEVWLADGRRLGGSGDAEPVPTHDVGGVPFTSSTPPPTPPPTVTQSAFTPIAAGSDSTTTATVVLPTTLVGGTTLAWPIQARTSAAPPALTGWTVLSASNGVGADALWIYVRHLVDQAAADAIEGTTLTVALGATTNYTSQLCGWSGSTGVISSRLAQNATLYGSTHPAPGTEVTSPAVATTAVDQLVVVIHGGRAQTSAARTWTPAPGTDLLAEGHTTSTTANNVHLLVSTYRTGAVGTVPVKTASTGGTIASLGAQLVLGHP